MKKHWIKIAVCLLFNFSLQSQELPLVLNKQGSFKIIDWGIYTHYNCGFTKADEQAHAKKITSIINLLRTHNPVLKELKGFMGQATLFAKDCDWQTGYGIPGQVRLEFCSFFINKSGKEVYSTIEPPSWYLYLNSIDKRDRHIPPKPGKDEDVRQGFQYEDFKSASEKLNELFFTRDVKQTIAPGVDRYGDEVVVYNPDRPLYWLPVTVHEAYERHFAYWKAAPDKLQADMALQFLEQEYASFTEEEKKGYAYAMGKGAFAKVGNDSTAPALVKANPDYWNRKLSKSAVQLITFILPANKKYLQQQAAEWLQNNSISYHKARFEASLDILDFSALIDK
ncbi:MAG: hypothetical protein ACXWV0_03155 [Flavisolibacter sp.]